MEELTEEEKTFLSIIDEWNSDEECEEEDDEDMDYEEDYVDDFM